MIRQTDQYGNQLEHSKVLLQREQNSMAYYLTQFSQTGVHYFSMDNNRCHEQETKQSSADQLAIIVLPEIRFHYKRIRQGVFDSEVIITTIRDDFVIWEFDQAISRDVIRCGKER